MNIIDLVFLLIILSFVILGFRKGIVCMFGSIVGTILGIFIAGLYYEKIANFLLPIFLGNLNLARIISFVLILILVNRIISFIFWIIVKLTDLIARLPFINIFNRLGGAFLGLIEANICLGLLLYFLSKYSLGHFFDNLLLSSLLAKPLISFVQFLIFLLPEEIRNFQSIFGNITPFFEKTNSFLKKISF